MDTKFKKGDKVICVKAGNGYYQQEGVVEYLPGDPEYDKHIYISPDLGFRIILDGESFSTWEYLSEWELVK